jgi:hypothetical protein
LKHSPILQAQLLRWKEEYLSGEYDKPDLVADLSEMLRSSEEAVKLVDEWTKEKRSRSVR